MMAKLCFKYYHTGTVLAYPITYIAHTGVSTD